MQDAESKKSLPEKPILRGLFRLIIVLFTVSVPAFAFEICNRVGEPIRYAVSWSTIGENNSGLAFVNLIRHAQGWYPVNPGQCVKHSDQSGRVFVEGLTSGRYWGSNNGSECIKSGNFRLDGYNDNSCVQSGGRIVGFVDVPAGIYNVSSNNTLVRVQNNSGTDVVVAWAFFRDQHWISHSWFNIPNGGHVQKSLGATSGKAYIYAKRADGSADWRGDNYFCVKGGNFEFTFADNSTKCANEGGTMVGMREVNISGGVGGMAIGTLTP